MAEIQYEKQLRIKSGALKRNHKEYLSYVKETEEKQTKVDMLKAEEPQDEYKIKKQVFC